LLQTAHGCRALAERWAHFGRILESGQPLKQEDLYELTALAGFPTYIPTHADTPKHRRVWLCIVAYEASFDASLRSFYACHGIPATVKLPDRETAYHFLKRWMQAREHKLRCRAKQLWHAIDKPERDESPTRALFDPSPEGKLLARYMNDAQRTLRLALKELKTAQKTRESDPTPEPEVTSPNEPNPPQPVPEQPSAERPVPPGPTIIAHGLPALPFAARGRVFGFGWPKGAAV
jgi:hypothetical protein